MVESFINSILAWLPRLTIGVAIFLAFYVLAVAIAYFIRKHLSLANASKQQILLLLATVAKGMLIILGLVTALGTMGVSVAGMVAGLGLGGFGLSYACKDALSNTLAGVMILFYQPFQINDRIKVSSFEGLVTAIDLRYVTLESDGETILIPNSNCLNNPVTVIHI